MICTTLLRHHSKGLLQVQQRWKRPLASACAAMEQAVYEAGYLKTNMLGIYLRGSLPQGCAVENVSDIDLCTYLLAPQVPDVNGMHKSKQEKLQELLSSARSTVTAEFEYVAKAGGFRLFWYQKLEYSSWLHEQH